MKRTIQLLAAILLLVSCQKEEIIREQLVTFNIGNIQSGSMTKAVDLTALDATAPSGPYTITLTSTTNSLRTYTLKTGEEASIILDEYNAVCTFYPSKFTEGMYSYIYKQPCFEARQTITIDENTTSVTLQASYTCFALFLDTETTAKYTLKNKNFIPEDLTDIASNGVVFIRVRSRWNAEHLQVLTAYPTDEANYEATSYNLVTEATADAILMENGKWYCFQPGAAESTSGTIGVDLPTWQQGQED